MSHSLAMGKYSQTDLATMHGVSICIIKHARADSIRVRRASGMTAEPVGA
jgi:hypothetical protein